MKSLYTTSDAIVFERPMQAAFKTIPVAPVDDDTIVVETTMSAISSGTDMKTWLGLQSGHKGVWFPLVPGYEAVGKVVHAGRNVTQVKVGDRVMANEVRKYPEHCAAWGGNARYMIKGPKTCNLGGMDAVAKIPDNVTDKEAVLDLMSQGKFDAKRLYSKVVPVDTCAAAYEELHRNRYDLLKILFKWS